MPAESVEFRRDLADVLNRHGVDNQAETPDFILADLLADLIPAIHNARTATATWMGQPLLGEKLEAHFNGSDTPR